MKIYNICQNEKMTLHSKKWQQFFQKNPPFLGIESHSFWRERVDLNPYYSYIEAVFMSLFDLFYFMNVNIRRQKKFHGIETLFHSSYLF